MGDKDAQLLRTLIAKHGVMDVLRELKRHVVVRREHNDQWFVVEDNLSITMLSMGREGLK